MACRRCGIEVSGHFGTPRLARLAPLHRDLAEEILLAGGNLKSVAETVGVSYPTLRKRVDDMIEAVLELRRQDAATTEELLAAVERGALAAEEAARRIGEMNGGR